MNARWSSIGAAAAVIAISAACKTATKPAAPADAGAAAAATAAAMPLAGEGHAGMAPIDCPLRKQGIDPAHLRPFEDVEKYVAFLERPDRASWQKPAAVVAALGLRGGETVVDVGAGSGYFSFPIARALPAGKVVAMDVEPEMVRHIHHRAMSEGAGNVEAVLGKPDDPGVPADADVVFVCDVLHHVPDRAAWLARLASEMKPGARLVLVEFKEGDLPQGPPEAAKIPKPELLRLAAAAGLALERDDAALLPYQTFLVFRAPVARGEKQ